MIKITQYNNSYVSAYMIREYISDLCEDKPEELKKMYSLLGDEARKSAYCPTSGTPEQMLRKDELLPAFILSTPEGNAISLNDIKGKIKILEFWSKNCSPCLQEIPRLFKLYEKYKPLGLEIVTISLDSDKQIAERLKKRHSLTWIQAGNYRENDTDIEKLYGINILPYKIILTGNNRIITQGNLSLREVEKLLDTVLMDRPATNTPPK